MSSIDSSAPAICRLRATAPISISEVWSKPFGAGLIATGATLVNVTVSLPSPARLRPASIRHVRRFHQRDRKTAGAVREHRDMLGVLGEGNAARAAGQGAVGIERDAVLRACRRHRHRAFGRGDLGLRQQPSRQHGFGERHRDAQNARPRSAR